MLQRHMVTFALDRQAADLVRLQQCSVIDRFQARASSRRSVRARCAIAERGHPPSATILKPANLGAYLGRMATSRSWPRNAEAQQRRGRTRS